MPQRLCVLTAWLGDGTWGNTYRPAIADRFVLASCTDITGQAVGNLTPSPNLCAVVVECTADVADAIEADPSYGPAAILWEEAT